jgi:glycosyltransferase involved in cell wall biosynthesis
VRFCGYIEENLKSIYYNSADIFCLPSTVSSEVFPLVLLEASASKLPLIVSDLETFKCIITEGYNGHFTKKNDVQDLAEKIEYLICNEGERLKLGFNARSFVEQFSWTKISDATIVCYQELLEKKTLNSNSW